MRISNRSDKPIIISDKDTITGLNIVNMKRILVIRLDEIGDVVLSTPFLRELRRNCPKAWITLIVKPECYALVETCPYINEVRLFNRNTIYSVVGALSKIKNQLSILLFCLFSIRGRKFDLVILPRWDWDLYYATRIVKLIRARIKIAFSEYVNEYKQKLNARFDRCFSHVIDDRSVKHEVEHNLEVIRCIGGRVEADGLELWITDEDRKFAELVLQQQCIGEGALLIASSPGASEAKRVWPKERYAEIYKWLIDDMGARLILFGCVSEKNLSEYFMSELWPGRQGKFLIL